MGLLKKILRAGKGPTEKKATIQDVIYNLRLISKVGNNVSDFYERCGCVFETEKDFWLTMAASGRAHAEATLKMADLIEKEPEKYRPGRFFSIASIWLFDLHLGNIVESMRAGKIQKDELLSIAVDIERSSVKLNYREIVQTDVPAYQAIARWLEENINEHRQAFEKRMEKVNQWGSVSGLELARK